MYAVATSQFTIPRKTERGTSFSGFVPLPVQPALPEPGRPPAGHCPCADDALPGLPLFVAVTLHRNVLHGFRSSFRIHSRDCLGTVVTISARHIA